MYYPFNCTVQHMLFMGSEKYPDENHYDSYISGHGTKETSFIWLLSTISFNYLLAFIWLIYKYKL